MGISTAEKALSLNLIKPLYGSIAEIGAGQEVARWFFKVGGAAGTIAKAMSAYDMAFSDDIYGKEDSGRYVVESRVRRMLEHEYSLLESRLSEQDNREKYFFAFANTVAAKSFKYSGDCHGWVGLKFQHSPDEEPSQVILHVRMLDSTNLRQQEALGTLGVNLIYACYHLHKDQNAFLSSMLDGELSDSIEINMVHFEGPLFKEIDPVQSQLLLLKTGLTQLVLIPAHKKPSHLGEELYNKQVIIHRGQFNPPIKTDLDILRAARDHYCGQKVEGLCDPYLISEIYATAKGINTQDICQRVSWLQQCGQNVMVTNFDRTYKLTEYVAQFTDNHINIVFRASKILSILENEKLASLDRLSRIFNERTRMYIYPVNGAQVSDGLKKDKSQALFNLSNYKPSDLNQFLYQHLVLSGYIQELTNFDPQLAPWDAQSGESLRSQKPKDWETLLSCMSPMS
jgi:hypothetical protein